MTEAQAVQLLERIDSLAAMLEVAVAALAIAAAFTVGATLHRWTSGR